MGIGSESLEQRAPLFPPADADAVSLQGTSLGNTARRWLFQMVLYILLAFYMQLKFGVVLAVGGVASKEDPQIETLLYFDCCV